MENEKPSERGTQDYRRRDFLRDAAKFSAGTLAAVAISERRLAAQAHRPQRVAVIGAGHYHATLAPFYLRILQNEKLDIVGVHDPDRAVAEDRAKRCGSVPFTDYRMMIEKTKPEFVLSLN